MAKVSMRQQVWNTLRVCKSCTLPDFKIACTSNINIDSVHHYLRALIRAGYVVKREDIFILIKNTGAKAPTKVTYTADLSLKDNNNGMLTKLKVQQESKLSEMIEFMRSIDTFMSDDLRKFTTWATIMNLISRLKKNNQIRVVGNKGKYKIYKYIERDITNQSK